MSEVVTFSDQKPLGTFAQIKLDDGKRILISITQTEIAVFKLILGGNIPSVVIWKHDIMDFIERIAERYGDENKTLLGAVTDIVLECNSIQEVAHTLEELINGTE